LSSATDERDAVPRLHVEGSLAEGAAQREVALEPSGAVADDPEQVGDAPELLVHGLEEGARGGEGLIDGGGGGDAGHGVLLVSTAAD
jgi:hypothetical protein